MADDEANKSIISDGIDTSPLDDDERAEAIARIKTLHPLKKLPLNRVFPWAAWVLKFCVKQKDVQQSGGAKHADYTGLINAGKDLGVSIHEPLLSHDDAADPLDDPSQDPYLSLGFGMVAYFTMLRSLIYMFTVFTLLSIPIISTYSSYEGLKDGNNYAKTKFSLGNLGFTEHLCKHIFVGIDDGKYEFNCRAGNVSKLSWSGILPQTDDTKVFSEYMGYCNDPSKIEAVHKCSGALRQAGIKNYIDTKCKGKPGCESEITVQDMMFAQTDPEAQGVDPVCWNEDSIIYLQYECQQEDEVLNVKKQQGLLTSCIGIFICGIYLSIMYYLNKTALLDFKQWDVDTVTAGDFTIEYKVPLEVWERFEDNHEDKTRAEGTDFEQYLNEEFERIVSEQKCPIHSDES
jgi:hypothetical protein